MGSSKRTAEDDSNSDDVKKIRPDADLQNYQGKIDIVDVQKLDYSVRTIQKFLKQIIDDVPNIHELEKIIALIENSDLARELKQNTSIQLASQLKTKHLVGDAPLIEEILNGSISLSDKNTKKLSKILKKLPVEAETNDITIQPTTNKAMYIGQSDDLTIDKTMPKLPKINNQQLYERVFIHRSFLNQKHFLDQDELLQLHNERLEFIGDSVLNNLVTLLIYSRYPNATEGSLTKMRSHLIDNKTLAVFSHQYGFNLKLKTNIDKSVLKIGDQKIYADVFEAYIGALTMEVKDNDYSNIKNWLIELYEPKLKSFDDGIDLKPINKDAKSQLYSLIGSAQLHPIYTLLVKGDGVNKNFVMECRIKDDVLGTGGAPNQRDAGLRAAMEALQNRSMLEKYYKLRMLSDPEKSINSQKNPPIITKPISPNIFPIIADLKSDLLSNEAKNELYAKLGKVSGIVPEYIITETEDGKFQADLKIKGKLVVRAIDSSKKKVATKAAMALLDNKEALDHVCYS